MERTQKDKVIIITGATGSMGIEATREMSRRGYTVIMACRNPGKAEAMRTQVIQTQPAANIEVHPLDLSSLASVRQFADNLHERPIDALFCNAGMLAHSHSLSPDGYETDIATNYLGNALLCELIVPHMPQGSHIVNMVSLTTKYAHISPDWPHWKPSQFTRLGTYGSSKLALLYYTISLARRNPHLYVNVSDPGIVDSSMITMGKWYDPLADIFFRPFIKTPIQGVQPALSALQSTNTLRYYVGKKQDPISKRFQDSPLVETLWEQLRQIINI